MNAVWLVGAGPGAPEHLTYAARQALEQADVVIHDTLVDPRVLALVRPGAQVYSVQGLSQAQINDLLVQHYRQNRQVVRLKSGDPFIFGKATQELAALAAAHCCYHVIPGVSTATGAATLAGIPLTDKQWGRSIGIVTAHAPEHLNWTAIAGLDTVVCLMGGGQLDAIQAQLLHHGKSPDTPAAIIHGAGQIGQMVWTGTLGELAQQPAQPPSVVIVGPGAAQQKLGQSRLPLAGKNILVTRAADSGSELTDRLQRLGAQVVSLPTLVVTPPPDWTPLDQALHQLATFDWLILTSANAVDFFLARLWEQGYDWRALAHLKIAVVGEKTATYLQSKGLRADVVPKEFVADALLDEFPKDCTGMRVLFPRVASGGRQVLTEGLQARGAHVTEVAAYETVCPRDIPPYIYGYLRQGHIHVLTFTSSKTVAHFCQLLEQAAPGTWQTWIAHSLIASIGPQTSRTCERYFQRVDIQAQEYTLDGLVKAIINYYG
ncbi:MAG: uroporphyrinogen-III C-methyltransferase [Gloeomargarita sp. SKYBB_i_bin120]|nr:uroporphyrinogen-III C-methyltransferase [Gloeomargarita sp. SKYB120]MDW8177467.1 uroporphyrinogen-III C-methyltransferase [Gloeomargarita sp. SKYBB_i_bin120]